MNSVTRSGCSTAGHSAACGALLVLAMLLAAPSSDAARLAGIDGTYRHAGRVAALLEVRRVPEGYAVKLQGGASPEAGAAAAADCVILAHGPAKGQRFEAGFDPVETDAFSYGAEQAARDHRVLRIVFGRGAAQVTEADVFGYCGLGATFLGRYRLVRGSRR